MSETLEQIALRVAKETGQWFAATEIKQAEVCFTVPQLEEYIREVVAALGAQEPVVEVSGGLKWIETVPWSKRPTEGQLYAAPQLPPRESWQLGWRELPK